MLQPSRITCLIPGLTCAVPPARWTLKSPLPIHTFPILKGPTQMLSAYGPFIPAACLTGKELSLPLAPGWHFTHRCHVGCVEVKGVAMAMGS